MVMVAQLYKYTRNYKQWADFKYVNYTIIKWFFKKRKGMNVVFRSPE